MENDVSSNLDAPRKKTIFSGMQPSGFPTIGNYIGAMKNWGNLQEEYNCLYCVVDMHAITIRQNPAELRKNSRDLLALYIACGLNPEKNIVYMQSHVAAHAELAWILNCFSYMGELGRMTQYKDKTAKQSDNINLGLFAYPVLMAADILLFNADLVPIGDDQKQHLELSRDIAGRFNGIYGNVFTIPQGYYGEIGARIMSLSDPIRKMSKSDDSGSYIALLDKPDVVMRKFKRAVTDSETEIRFDTENKPGVSNLLTILASAKNISIENAQNQMQGCNYGQLKEAVGIAVIEGIINPIQQKFAKLSGNPDYLDSIMEKNAEAASRLAERTMRKVRKKIGFYAAGSKK
ncbi:MAG: tryptophan--tRNA ligase [Defluviitaleaceae bacterium]|nr:tryptophan--tRNA ligase [Defluviitaleaceae bacterium]